MPYLVPLALAILAAPVLVGIAVIRLLWEILVGDDLRRRRGAR